MSTFPLPSDRDYIAVGGHFGPHNIHENRPGSFQSETLIFATYQNAGVRVYDISDQLAPEGGRRLRAAGAEEAASTRARTGRSCSTPPTSSSTRTASAYCTDWSGAGLYIMEYLGA